MAFIDELTIYAKAGNGGDGVQRWRHEKFRPKAGPAGGNGGKGGDVYVRAVRDVGLLSKYTGHKKFIAQNGEAGQSLSRHGKGSEDLYIDVPVGSVVTDRTRQRTYELYTEGQEEKILHGGQGGLGNEYFKSATNRSPQQTTAGKAGEEGDFTIELTLVVDVGFIGLPNAGKSSLLNALTNARSQVGDYAFTTLEPHLGDFYGFILADIPGLIAGASTGKGLGHTFLRHVTRTKMLLHLVSLEQDDLQIAYETVRHELTSYQKSLSEKEEWIILTKKDLVNKGDLENSIKSIDKNKKRVFAISVNNGEGIKELADALVARLREG